jgi:hypothetical protein
MELIAVFVCVVVEYGLNAVDTAVFICVVVE